MPESQQNLHSLPKPRLSIKELWEKSDAITREIIHNPNDHPIAFAKMILDGEFVPPSVQRITTRFGELDLD